MSDLVIRGGDGKWSAAPNILIKKAEGKMRDTRDRLRHKLGDKYNGIVSPIKELVLAQMRKDNKGPVETSNWFIAAFHRKKKLTPLKHAALIAVAYEIIESKV